MSDVDDDVFLAGTTPGYTPHTWEGQATKAYNDAFKFDVAPPKTTSGTQSSSEFFVASSPTSPGTYRQTPLRKAEPDSPVWQYATNIESRVLSLRRTKRYRLLVAVCALIAAAVCFFGPFALQLGVSSQRELYVLTALSALAGAFIPRICLWGLQVLIALAAGAVELVITLLKLAVGLAVIGGALWLISLL